MAAVVMDLSLFSLPSPFPFDKSVFHFADMVPGSRGSPNSAMVLTALPATPQITP